MVEGGLLLFLYGFRAMKGRFFGVECLAKCSGNLATMLLFRATCLQLLDDIDVK